ncbi:MAG: hypothetical protein ACM3ML_08795 [Micromonosporaceae bacterium]
MGDRTLAFLWLGQPPSRSGVRLLDTSQPGTDLMNSGLLIHEPAGHEKIGMPVISPDGSKVFATVTSLANQNPTSAVAEFSARTGSLIRTLTRRPMNPATAPGVACCGPTRRVTIFSRPAVAKEESTTGASQHGPGRSSGETRREIPSPGDGGRAWRWPARKRVERPASGVRSPLEGRIIEYMPNG